MSPIMHRAKLSEFMQRLERGAFYDAHESLESIWFPRRFENDPEMKLLKGFINAAVSFELIKRGRPGPSERAWRNYRKYLPLMHSLQSDHAPVYRQMAAQIETIRSKHG